jgi:hypothetical protein
MGLVRVVGTQVRLQKAKVLLVWKKGLCDGQQCHLH